MPTSGELPVGFVLNPCTVKKAAVDWRGNGAYEREQNADQKLGYIDLIYDTNPDFTVKNQLFYDNIDSFKDSWLPYGENQYIKTIEDKITVTKRVPAEWLPEWLSINALSSINYRETTGWIRSGGVAGNDYDYRQDILFDGGSGTGGHFPNTMFWTQLSNPSYATGSPAESYRKSKFDEKGVALIKAHHLAEIGDAAPTVPCEQGIHQPAPQMGAHQIRARNLPRLDQQPRLLGRAIGQGDDLALEEVHRLAGPEARADRWLHDLHEGRLRQLRLRRCRTADGHRLLRCAHA